MNKRKTGALEERRACEFLEQKGYLILSTNFHEKFAELDIVARDGEYIVFAEVKYRSNSHIQDPLDAVDMRKRRRIALASLMWLSRNGMGADTPCRFDVLAIYPDKIKHVRNAFSLDDAAL